MKLKIAAVGSSALIAGEIRDILRSLLGSEINILTFTTSEVTADSPADIFACAQTQYRQLLKVLPPSKVCLLDLTPSSTFFLEISHIPNGSAVGVFNNRFAYPISLTEYCRTLGINTDGFTPLAFEEMALSDLLTALRQQDYIIGVDQFLNENVLLAEPYYSALKPNVHIIPGRRTASPASCFTLLHRISKLMLYKASLISQTLTPENTDALLTSLDELISIVQAATIRSVVIQVSLQQPQSTQPAAAELNSDILSAQQLIDERLSTLRLLTEKLLELATK